MICGIGTDIVYIPRFYNIFVNTYRNDPAKILKFCRKFMHPYELQKFEAILKQKTTGSAKELAQNAAGIWSVKESLYKSLNSLSLNHTMPPAITIYSSIFYKSNNLKTGAPMVNVDLKNLLKGKLVSEEFQKSIVDSIFHLSVSHDHHYVVSYVVRECIHSGS